MREQAIGSRSPREEERELADDVLAELGEARKTPESELISQEEMDREFGGDE